MSQSAVARDGHVILRDENLSQSKALIAAARFREDA